MTQVSAPAPRCGEDALAWIPLRENRNDLQPTTLGGAQPASARLVFRPAVDGSRDLPRGAAGARARCDERRRAAVRQKRHRNRTRRLADDGRPAARLDLGPWRLRGAGLERGLAAPRGRGAARDLGQTRARIGVCRAGPSDPRIARGAPSHRAAPEHLRSRNGHAHRLTGPRARHRQRRRALHQPVRQRSRYGEAPRRLRDARRHDRHARAPREADGVLLLDRVGGRHRSSGRDEDLYQQLALRSARRQHAHAVHVSLDRVQRAVPDRRHRTARLAPCAHGGARLGATTAGVRSAAASRRHAVDARECEVLLAGDRAVPGADPARSNHRALPGRRTEFLRTRARGRAAVFAVALVAYRARRAVDRDGLARHRAFTSRRQSPGTSRDSSASASTCCSARSS